VPAPREDTPSREAPELKARDFKLLSDLIHGASGVRLGHDKRELLASRLRPLLRKLGVKTFAGLSAAVHGDASGEKLGLLVDRATTNTTVFFRHKPQLDLLRSHLKKLGGGGSTRIEKRIRIWSAGCSTGEEPYSIALLILEAGLEGVAKVLATDVSRRALAKAKQAVYDGSELEPVPPLLRKHFEPRGDGTFALDAATRGLVTLRRHDLREGTAAAGSVFDAVFCRNVLIYFEGRERAAAVARLAHVLKKNGLFFLGPSESGVELPASFVRIGPASYEKVA
jgi:chemotaxis protein methyltransferase CheR